MPEIHIKSLRVTVTGADPKTVQQAVSGLGPVLEGLLAQRFDGHGKPFSGPVSLRLKHGASAAEMTSVLADQIARGLPSANPTNPSS